MDQLLLKLDQIENRLIEQNLLQKEVLNVKEATTYLNISQSHLYKLTSRNVIPCYSPNGKFIYFRRDELDNWLTTKRRSSIAELEQQAADYISTKQRRTAL